MRYTPLTHRRPFKIRQAHVTIRPRVHIVHVLEGHSRHEAARLPRLADLVVELIDLLEREALGLVDHGVDEGDADEAAAAPDEEDLGLQVDALRRLAGVVVHEVGGGVSDCEVEKPGNRLCQIGLMENELVHLPVGGGSHGQCLCTDFGWEDLTL